METLTATFYPVHDFYMLEDSKGHIIARGNLDSHIKFCKESGYRLCIVEGKKIRWA